MVLFIETVAETQKTTLAAAGVFAESFLAATERVLELHIELTRAAVNTSAEMAQECIDVCLVRENVLSPSFLLRFASALQPE